MDGRDEGAVAVSGLGRSRISVLPMFQKQEECAVGEQRDAHERCWEEILAGLGTRRRHSTPRDQSLAINLAGKARTNHTRLPRPRHLSLYVTTTVNDDEHDGP